MANSVAIEELKAVVAAQIAQAKQLSVAELAALGEAGTTFKFDIHARTYDINTWSEPVPGDASGAIAVLVGAWSKSFFGFSKSHFAGFVACVDGSHYDIPESDLWRYD